MRGCCSKTPAAVCMQMLKVELKLVCTGPEHIPDTDIAIRCAENEVNCNFGQIDGYIGTKKATVNAIHVLYHGYL